LGAAQVSQDIQVSSQVSEANGKLITAALNSCKRHRLYTLPPGVSSRHADVQIGNGLNFNWSEPGGV
jgi:hypothetical protein